METINVCISFYKSFLKDIEQRQEEIKKVVNIKNLIGDISFLSLLEILMFMMITYE